VTPLDHPALITSVIGGIFMLLAAWLGVRWKNKEPLTRKAAELAIAEQQIGMATGLNTMLSDAIKRQDAAILGHSGQLQLMAQKVKAQDDKIESQGEKIARLERLLDSSLRYVETLLRYIIKGRKGPVPRPSDEELHDQIDPDLHAWRATQ